MANEIVDHWPAILNATKGVTNYIRFQVSGVAKDEISIVATQPKDAPFMIEKEAHLNKHKNDKSGTNWYVLKLTGTGGQPPRSIASIISDEITITIAGDGGTPTPVTSIVHNGVIG